METHRYVRPQLTTTKNNSVDQYNGLISSFSSSVVPNDTPTEYWTNGTVTHIGVTPSSSAAAFTKMTQAEPHQMVTTSSTPTTANNNTDMTTRAKSSFHASVPPTSISNTTAIARPPHMIRNSLLAGSMAGMVSTAVIYPMDVLRTKLQNSGAVAAHGNTTPTVSVRMNAQQQWISSTTTSTSMSSSKSSSVAAVWRETIAQGGLRALYTGMTLPLLAQAVYKGTVFSVQKISAELLQEQRAWEAQKTGQVYYTRAGLHQQQQQQQQQAPLSDVWISGAVAGAVNALLFVTPVEFVRNQWIAGHHHHHHQQQQQQVWNSATAAADRSMVSSNNNGRVSSSLFRKTTATTSTWHFVRRTVQQHGLSSLWRGASWTVARDGIGCGFFFWTMAYTSRECRHHQEPLSFGATLACGALSGLAFWVSSLPLDTIKTWVQSADLSQSNGTAISSPNTLVRQRLEQLYHGTDGGGMRAVTRGLFRGWQVAYGRGMPAAAITMAVYLYALDGLQRIE